MSTLDDVISTVLRAREDGPDALAAVALSFGSAMELGTLGNTALKARLAETRAALEATEATAATLRTERDAASAAAKAARQRMEEVREQCDRARDDAEMCARQRDEARARASMLAQDLARVEAERDEAREALAAKDSAPDLDYPARAEVWKLREAAEALRGRAEKAETERDAAVQEREAFSLRLSAAERERDEARAERDALRDRPAYEARTVAPTASEADAHAHTGGAWLVAWHAGERVRSAILSGEWERELWRSGEGTTWLALDARRLPCAWPVVP